MKSCAAFKESATAASLKWQRNVFLDGLILQQRHFTHTKAQKKKKDICCSNSDGWMGQFTNGTHGQDSKWHADSSNTPGFPQKEKPERRPMATSFCDAITEVASMESLW